VLTRLSDCRIDEFYESTHSPNAIRQFVNPNIRKLL